MVALVILSGPVVQALEIPLCACAPLIDSAVCRTVPCSIDRCGSVLVPAGGGGSEVEVGEVADFVACGLHRAFSNRAFSNRRESKAVAVAAEVAGCVTGLFPKAVIDRGDVTSAFPIEITERRGVTEGGVFEDRHVNRVVSETIVFNAPRQR
jgi:hypothetical protein